MDEQEIPDSWDDLEEDNSYSQLEEQHKQKTSDAIQSLSKELRDLVLDYEKSYGPLNKNDFDEDTFFYDTIIQSNISSTISNNNNNNNTTTTTAVTAEEDEPLLLINFTKWSSGKIKWNNETKSIDNQSLYDRLLDKLDNDETVFTEMTDDLLERELAFHSTTTQWKSDIKLLENKYKGDFFSSVSYPTFLGGFLVESIWSKVKEKTKWSSVNILKCLYLAKTNRSLLYKHSMALALEFMAMEQDLLGPTAKKLKQEEELEEQAIMKSYQERVQKHYEQEINEGIIKNLQNQIFNSEGIKNVPQEQEQQQQQQVEQVDEEEQDEEEQDEDDNMQDDEDEEDNEDDYNENEQDDNNDADDENDESNTESSIIEDDIDDADNELDDEDKSRKNKKKSIEEKRIREIENEKAIKLKQRNQLEPPPQLQNILDKIIAMIFIKLFVPHNQDKAKHFQQLSVIQESIKDKWIEEFGCLPPNCLWREDI